VSDSKLLFRTCLLAIAAGWILWGKIRRRGIAANNSLVVVTGASSGVGEATARLFAAKGATVILLARTKSKLDQIVLEIQRSGGKAFAHAVDLGDIQATQQVIHEIRAQYGTPDILVNNAGMGEWKWPEDTTPQEAVTMMSAPYVAAFTMSSGFLRPMLDRGSGLILNVNSPAAYATFPGATAYIAARRALKGLSDALYFDTYSTGVIASQICFGYVQSSYWENNKMPGGGSGRVPWMATLFRPHYSPQECASAIVLTVERGDREVILPLLLRLSIALYWGPGKWLVDSLLLATRIQRSRK